MSKPAARRLGDWITSFFEYTDGMPSPKPFRRWAGITTIAGALERKVWVYTAKKNLYPNLFTLLVAPPGIGKTIMTATVQRFWKELPDHHLAPSAMSRASLADALREAERHLIMPSRTPSIVNFNSLLIVSNELATLIPVYDMDFMGTLTEIYDGEQYGEKKRGKDLNYSIPNPQINLLAATTPSYLNNVMPEGAWDQGFISRVIMVFSGESVLIDLFAEEVVNVKLYQDLIHDLKIIGSMYGKFDWTEDAADLMVNWYLNGNPPKPDHPKLSHYSSRRTQHCLKLCMIASASRGDDLKITAEDYSRALNWLLSTEESMSDIFKAMAQGGDHRAMEDCWHYCYKVYIADKSEPKKSIPHAQVWNFLSQRVPSYNIDKILKAMVMGGLLKEQIDGYKPAMKKGQI